MEDESMEKLLSPGNVLAVFVIGSFAAVAFYMPKMNSDRLGPAPTHAAERIQRLVKLPTVVSEGVLPTAQNHPERLTKGDYIGALTSAYATCSKVDRIHVSQEDGTAQACDFAEFELRTYNML